MGKKVVSEKQRINNILAALRGLTCGEAQLALWAVKDRLDHGRDAIMVDDLMAAAKSGQPGPKSTRE